MAYSGFSLQRDAYGRLVLSDENGLRHEAVVPVRAFPIAAPDEGISLVLGNGKEVAWIERLDTLPEPARSLLQEELEGREFMPEILDIVSVTSFSTPCTWSVKTDRGDTQFVLRGDEDIRRVGPTVLLVTDSHGIQFKIRDLLLLSKESRKIMDRFL